MLEHVPTAKPLHTLAGHALVAGWPRQIQLSVNFREFGLYSGNVQGKLSATRFCSNILINLARILLRRAIRSCLEARFGSEAEWIFLDSIQPETWISRQNSADVPAFPRHYG